MDEKYKEAYYRLQVLIDYLTLASDNSYVHKKEIFAILGIANTIEEEDGHQE